MANASQESWRDNAECRDVGFAMFYPQVEVDDDVVSIANFVVKDEPGNPGYYCARCTVSEECLAYSVSNRIADGIFGGINEEQRKRLINIDIRVRREHSREARAKRKLDKNV